MEGTLEVFGSRVLLELPASVDELIKRGVQPIRSRVIEFSRQAGSDFNLSEDDRIELEDRTVDLNSEILSNFFPHGLPVVTAAQRLVFGTVKAVGELVPDGSVDLSDEGGPIADNGPLAGIATMMNAALGKLAKGCGPIRVGEVVLFDIHQALVVPDSQLVLVEALSIYGCVRT